MTQTKEAFAGTTKQITNKKMLELLQIINAVDYKKRDLFTYACQKIGHKLAKIMEVYNEKVDDIHAEFCKKEKDGTFIRKEVTRKEKDGTTTTTSRTGELEFDDKGNKEVRKKIKALLEETVDVPVYFAKEYETNESYKQLNLRQRNTLAGIVLPLEVINEDDDEKALEFWMNTAPEEKPVISKNGTEN